MAEFVVDAFEEDETRGDTEIVVLGYQRKFWWTQPAMRPAFKLLREWRLREPVELRKPAPVQVVRAVMGVALAWNWPAFALITWIGSHCLLRPGEMCGILKSHVRLLSGTLRVLSFKDIGVIILNRPKTRKTAARPRPSPRLGTRAASGRPRPGSQP